MTEVPAPKFHPDMLKALLDGMKFCTTRSRKLGEIGDTFTIEGQTFRYRRIQSLPFGEIARVYYRCEGFGSEQDFKRFWIGLHRGHLPPDDSLRWLHVLEKV